jgi:hypothetical protein
MSQPSGPALLALITPLLVQSPLAAATAVSGFDDLTLAPDSFLIGNPQPAPGGTTTFSSGFASYDHVATDFGFGFTAWTGWAYSNVVDATTPGFGNQYASRAGGGANGSSNYVVGYAFEPIATAFAAPTALAGAYFSNTTYTALSIIDGDAFTEPFSLADDDYFDLTIQGVLNGMVTGSLRVSLADYRGATPVVVADWLWVDLGLLGTVDGLRFSLASSDTGPFGINTPSYFAMDELTAVPVPAALWLAASALLPLTARCRRRSRQRVAL